LWIGLNINKSLLSKIARVLESKKVWSVNFLNIIQLVRFIVGGTWIYHGLFPKLLQIAPLEQAMAGSLGFNEEITYLLIKSAGIGEILFGVVFICFYRNKVVQLLNIAGLLALLVFAGFMTPTVLVEAFNPVTTNIPLLLLSYILLQNTAVAVQSQSRAK
jgi:hypothetical protein